MNPVAGKSSEHRPKTDIVSQHAPEVRRGLRDTVPVPENEEEIENWVVSSVMNGVERRIILKDSPGSLVGNG